MGLLDKLFNRDSKYYLDKVDKYIKAEDLGEALACVRKAQELAGDNEDEKNAVAEKEDELKGLIYHKAYEQAKQYLRGGQADAAKNALDRAARYVRNDAEREALNKLVDDSEHWEEEKIVEARVEGEERVTGLDTSDKWNLYVTSLPFAKAQHCDELGDDFKKAWVALQEGDFDEAISGLEAVYKAHSDDALVMCELGRAYYGKGRIEDAERMLKKSDDAQADIDTKMLHVEILWAMKKFNDAEEVLQSAHDMDPDNIQVLARIAQHGLIAHDLESGIDAVEVLLERLPNDISVQRLAGRLYMANNDEDKALECYETVNRIYWQVNPQTHKLTFDQNSAAAAAAIYFKRGENLDRCVELLEAIRANSTGETHVGVCLQLAEVYEKMERKSKRTEVLGESMRFMDEMLEKVKGGERAMLQLQYSEVAGKIGDTDKETEMIQEARRFFAADAEKGHPVAAFYIDLIDQKLAGKPFPDAAEIQEKLEAFVDKIRREYATRQEAVVSEADSDDSDDSEEEVQASMIDEQSGVQISSVSMENADDILKRMAALANNQQSPIITFSSGDDSEDEDSEDGEDSSDDDASGDDSDKGEE